MTTVELDALDRKILRELQRDATRSIDNLAAKLATSRTPVWSRIQKMRKAGVIERQVALVNPAAVGLNETFYVAVRTDQHVNSMLSMECLKRTTELSVE